MPKEIIIRLPWNEKHYFHDYWIAEWINKNPWWPLWKAKITEELLKAWEENEKDSPKNDEEKNEDQFEFRRMDMIVA